MNSLQRGIFDGPATLSQLLDLQLVTTLGHLHLGLHVLELVEELQSQGTDFGHAVEARQLQGVDTSIPRLHHLGQPVIRVKFGPLLLQLSQATHHPINGSIVMLDVPSNLLEPLTSLLGYSIHPIVDYLCSAHRGPNGQLGSPQHAVGTYKGKLIHSLRRRDLLLTLGVIQGHIHQPVKHRVLVHRSTSTKAHPLAGYHSRSPDKVFVLQITEGLRMPIRTIDTSHDVHGPRVIVGQVTRLSKPSVNRRSPNGPHGRSSVIRPKDRMGGRIPNCPITLDSLSAS